MIKPGTSALGTDSRSASPIESPGFIAWTWVGAIRTHDFAALEAVLAPNVTFRALVPNGMREADTSDGAIALIERWFGDADITELVATAEGQVADRTWFTYRFHVHEPTGWTIVEQQVYATVNGGRIEKLDLLCSGFRPA